MCITKFLKKRVHNKSQKAIRGTIYIASFTIIYNQKIYVEKVDNFNPNATHVNNSHYNEPPQDEETEDEPKDEL